jgi:hypothetical protein
MSWISKKTPAVSVTHFVAAETGVVQSGGNSVTPECRLDPGIHLLSMLQAWLRCRIGVSGAVGVLSDQKSV